jgi:hypothetical protein
MDTNTGHGHHGPTPADHPDPYAGAVDKAAIARGHEADSYDAKSVLSVPLLVVVFFVLAFSVVSTVFAYVRTSDVDPKANEWAVKQNSVPLDERFDRIHRGGEVDQPRLEPLRLRTGYPQAITSPETPTGNSPEIHPDDIIPSPQNTPELYKTAPPSANNPVAKITIDEAMSQAVKGKMFPTQKAGTALPKSTNVPTLSNAGRGFGASEASPPKLPGQPVPPKAEEPKKDAPKEEGKK